MTLRVTNRDPSAALSLDCVHQADRCFWVSCEPSVLEAGQSLEVPLNFAPRDTRHYAFGVPFLVNGSYTVKLVVVGEGCPARLELGNMAHKHLTFGLVPEGQQVAKQVCNDVGVLPCLAAELKPLSSVCLPPSRPDWVRFVSLPGETLFISVALDSGVYFTRDSQNKGSSSTAFVIPAAYVGSGRVCSGKKHVSRTIYGSVSSGSAHANGCQTAQARPVLFYHIPRIT